MTDPSLNETMNVSRRMNTYPNPVTGFAGKSFILPDALPGLRARNTGPQRDYPIDIAHQAQASSQYQHLY
jgi:hypothetical protein